MAKKTALRRCASKYFSSVLAQRKDGKDGLQEIIDNATNSLDIWTSFFLDTKKGSPVGIDSNEKKLKLAFKSLYCLKQQQK